MSDDDLRETMRLIQIEVRRKRILLKPSLSAVADENAARGAAFLEENKAKPGVVVLPSGLQYRILKSGSGRIPIEADTVECRFIGSFIDGRVFTGPDPDGKPVALKVAEASPGWKEALLLMPTGSKWQLVVPPPLTAESLNVNRPRLAPRAGPNETLVYEVELLAIK
jgi:FKBP-type peptidyl-prolyl cis-trans isomerase FklB